jgi:hypothetical protein
MEAGRSTPAAAECASWRMHVEEPFRLRDYFLRLGALAEVADGEAVVTVTTAEEDISIEESVASWSRINGIPVTFQPVNAAESASGPVLFAMRPRLGDLLVRKGMITDTQLTAGLAESRTKGEMLGRVLIRTGWLFEDELARVLAEQLELPYVSLAVVGVDYAVARTLPSEVGQRVAALPIASLRGRVRVAFADPCDDGARAAVHRHLGDCEVVVAEFSDIERAWRRIDRGSGG